MGFLDVFRKKTEIIRDNQGNVAGITGASDLDVTRYLGIFDSKVRNRNYITLFSEIAEIQFPVLEIIKRALNANFHLKKYDSDEIIWSNKAINTLLSQPNETDTFQEFLSKIIAC
ncbi:MAG: hypothetical protein LBU37_13570, partial [Tannerellaceae bacterium]|nr:hypothetical protein [Tannerellaceae bacterium]